MFVKNAVHRGHHYHLFYRPIRLKGDLKCTSVICWVLLGVRLRSVFELMTTHRMLNEVFAVAREIQMCHLLIVVHPWLRSREILLLDEKTTYRHCCRGILWLTLGVHLLTSPCDRTLVMRLSRPRSLRKYQHLPLISVLKVVYSRIYIPLLYATSISIISTGARSFGDLT